MKKIKNQKINSVENNNISDPLYRDNLVKEAAQFGDPNIVKLLQILNEFSKWQQQINDQQKAVIEAYEEKIMSLEEELIDIHSRIDAEERGLNYQESHFNGFSG